MHLPSYQIFGSPSSLDVDIVFFINEIPTTKAASELCKMYSSQLNYNREVNANLAVLGQMGNLIDVFKGTTDELNNALFYTYHHHKQHFPQQIRKLLTRDIHLKILRCARVILSFLSRTTIRTEVKVALKGNLVDKVSILKNINLADFQELGKHGGLVAFYKTAAFQLGQTLALAQGQELYTKEAISHQFPQLSAYLMRKPQPSVQQLQNVLTRISLVDRETHSLHEITQRV